MNDLRFALRQLLKNPGFAAVAVLTLALGIGLNVAVFSMANAVLWRPLPFVKPGQLVALGEGDLSQRSRSGVSAANFRDWQEHCRSFSEMAALRVIPWNLGGVADPERLLGAQVSEQYFDMLRVQPELGRFFAPGDSVSGDPHLALLSHRLWKRRFAGSQEMLGKAIKLNGQSYTIIGVTPKSVESFDERIDVWTPLVIAPELLLTRDVQPWAMYARMRPGIRIEQARAEMKASAGTLAADYPSVYRHLEIWVSPLGVSDDAGPVFRFLLAVTGAILLIACANLASLLLLRSIHRRQEICVRTALGAGRSRIIRQLLTESLILSLVGGGGGLLFARWGSDFVKSALPAGLAAQLPSFLQFQLDWRVLIFAFLVCLGAALIFGLVPALEGSKINLSSDLQSGGRNMTRGHQAWRLSAVFVGAQVAVCFATVLFTAICLRSLQQASEKLLDSGFNSKNLLTFEMTLAGKEFSRLGQRTAFLEQLTARIRALPGVRSVSGADSLPFAGLAWRHVSAAGGSNKGEKELMPYAAAVGPSYFETLGIPLLRGRTFTRQDNFQSAPVAIVSEYLAQRLFGKANNPIGQRIKLRGEPREIEIVGIAPNVQQALLATIRSHTMNLYLSQLQFCGERAIVAVRAEGDPKALMPTIRRAVSEINADCPPFAVRTMDELIALDQQFFRYLTWCMAVFSVLAVALAAVGIYGTVAFTVAQRTREFGVRMALGATACSILTLVTFHAMRPIAIGLACGIMASIWLVRPLIQALFYDLARADLWMFLSVGIALTLSTGMASLLPAIKAGRVNPLKALRHE